MKFYKDHYDVVIMGGALAGMSAALQLQAQGVKDILILEKHNLPGGLATDYCVLNTVLQLKDAGFTVILNEAACRGIAPDTTKAALEKMKAAGVILVKNAAALKSISF